MDVSSVLQDISIIFGFSVAMLLICSHLRLPLMMGFFIVGATVGPYGLKLVSGEQDVNNFAEVGVVLLLFTIGMEFSLTNLIRLKKAFFVGGGLQVGLTIAATFVSARFLGKPIGQSIFLGFLLALSSTAIVLKLLQERSEVESPHGRLSLGILIFQDCASIPMMLAAPLLGAAAAVASESGQNVLPVGRGPVVILAIKSILLLAAVWTIARWVVPRLLYLIARTRNNELFLMAVGLIGLGTAWLTLMVGLSLALGAFLAGLIISESPYSRQALGNILPFRDVFTSFFFVSIGMLVDVGFLARHWLLLIILTPICLLLKSGIAGLVVMALGLPLRTAILTGLAVSQVGEFSFILAGVGLTAGLLPGDANQTFLAVSVLTMAASPFLINSGPKIADFLTHIPLPRSLHRGFATIDPSPDEHPPLADHLIIVGYGFNGSNLARAASGANLPYVILEMNPDTVKKKRAEGEPIFYGDASHPAVLEHLGVESAKLMVIAISDPMAIRRATNVARRLNPRLYIIARTRFVSEIEPLQKLGADEVVPEEFETSIEIIVRVLSRCLLPREEIDAFVARIREGGYDMLRSMASGRLSLADLKIHAPDLSLDTIRVGEDSRLAGQTLSGSGLRQEHGVTVLAIRRGDEVIANPTAETMIAANDLLIVMGMGKSVLQRSDQPRQSGANNLSDGSV